MSTIFTLSDLLGYTSIACWLGAQFPQVLENIRRQSCEGLAFPFLLNWLLGDLSNLVGCILTRQLPFQTYLAIYFVLVDCSLVFQYFYYAWRTKPSLGYPRSLISGAGARRLSRDRGASRYRTLSAVAANVAAAAALAAQQNEQLDHRRRRQKHSEDHERSDRHAFEEHAAENDVEEDGLPAMTASFHSEGGHEPGQKRVSWSTERHNRRGGSVDHMSGISRSSIPPRLQLTSADSLIDFTGRGRSLQRVDGVHPASTDRQSPRTGRRATMVFLGAWAFFSIGAFVGVRHGAPTGSSSPIGRVLAVQSLHAPALIPVVESHVSYDTSLNFLLTQQWSERVVGRIFAWLCTTLYLTSRLPQIWKNFVRKSVEGLSMYLFVFAFFGNVFYVASILSSSRMNLPPSASTDFIKESIPYLLGSGGTLMFDITIVTQSFIYRPRPRRHSLAHSRLDEEETGLLAGESMVRPNTSLSESLPRGRTSRARNSTL